MEQGLGGTPSICISNNFPDDSAAAGWGPLRKPWTTSYIVLICDVRRSSPPSLSRTHLRLWRENHQSRLLGEIL